MRPGASRAQMAPMPRCFRAPLAALALGLFDRGQGVPETRIDWMIEEVESFLEHAGSRTAWIFLFALAVLELFPLLLLGEFARMSRLSPLRRAEYLERFDRSRLAIVLALPKALLAIVYYEHPDAVRETGYDGGCMIGKMPEAVELVQLHASQGPPRLEPALEREPPRVLPASSEP